MTAPADLRWISWVDDPTLQRAGFTFDRTEAGSIQAPPGQYRVCAYHLDFSERPTCYVDVPTLREAIAICDDLPGHCRHNVDYAVAYDERGDRVHGGWG